MTAAGRSGTVSSRGRALRLAVLLIPVIAPTACSTPAPEHVDMPHAVDISGYSDVHAALDPAAETMTFPIDAFFLSPAAVDEVDQANAILWDECMRAGGRSYPPAAFDLSSSSQEPDTLYGIWNSENAARWGYGFDPAADAEVNRANDAMMAASAADPGWDPAFEECMERPDRIPQPGRYFGGEDEVAISGPATAVANDASMLARADLQWDAARATWSDCLLAKGLRLREEEDSPWSPEVPEDPEEAIRTAVLDVQCKQETGLVDTLSSLEAQYQAALIDQNRAALDEVAEKEQEIMERARKILAENGR